MSLLPPPRAPRLGDFGIAKQLEETGQQAETVVGTPFYFSPEVCAGKPYGDRSDVWYELETAPTHGRGRGRGGDHRFWGHGVPWSRGPDGGGCCSPWPSLRVRRAAPPEGGRQYRPLSEPGPTPRGVSSMPRVRRGSL